MSEEREYQGKVKAQLDRLYDEVAVQWYPFRGHGRTMYNAAVDVAVGPFATGNLRYENQYTELLKKNRKFIELLVEKHNQNVEEAGERVSFNQIINANENARCLLAIEIEDSGSRKHCLGNLVNVSALGRIGILVARNEKILRIFLRQRVYLKYLLSVGKNTLRTDNTLVLAEKQFDECLTAISHQ